MLIMKNREHVRKNKSYLWIRFWTVLGLILIEDDIQPQPKFCLKFNIDADVFVGLSVWLRKTGRNLGGGATEVEELFEFSGISNLVVDIMVQSNFFLLFKVCKILEELSMMDSTEKRDDYIHVLVCINVRKILLNLGLVHGRYAIRC